MPEMICPFCQRIYQDDFKWCMDDGSELEQNLGQYAESEHDGTMVPCPECGEPVDTRDLFCGNCATKLEGRLPQPEPDEYESYGGEEYDEPMPPPSAGAPPPPPPAPGAPPPPVQEPMPPVPEESAGPTRECPSCGAQIGLADTFCGTCGAELESAVPAAQLDGTIQGRVCPHCAAGLEPTDTYCGVCGNPVEPEIEPPAAQICSSCGMELGPEDTFCGTCGNPVQQQAADDSSTQAAPAAAGTCPSCGMDVAPGEAFCGTCGNPVGEGAGAPEEQPVDISVPPAEAPAPEVPPAEAPAAGTCPNCGMDVAPGEAFCGTCGNPVVGDAGVPEETPVEILSPEEPAVPGEVQEMPTPPPGVPVSAESEPAAAGVCPNCGMETAPDDTFCATCGNPLGGEGEAPAAEPEGGAPGVEAGGGAQYPSIADITADIPVCPQCGLEGEAGQTMCRACGVEMTTEGNLDPGVPGAFVEPGAEESVEAAAEGQQDQPGIPPAEPTADGQKICSVCGQVNTADAEFCANCGVDL